MPASLLGLPSPYSRAWWLSWFLLLPRGREPGHAGVEVRGEGPGAGHGHQSFGSGAMGPAASAGATRPPSSEPTRPATNVDAAMTSGILRCREPFRLLPGNSKRSFFPHSLASRAGRFGRDREQNAAGDDPQSPDKAAFLDHVEPLTDGGGSLVQPGDGMSGVIVRQQDVTEGHGIGDRRRDRHDPLPAVGGGIFRSSTRSRRVGSAHHPKLLSRMSATSRTISP